MSWPWLDIFYALIAFEAFVFALVLVALARRLGGRFGFVDAVNPAKIHEKPMVRCGGAGIFAAFMLALGADIVLARVLKNAVFVPDEIRNYLGNIGFVGGKLTALIAGAVILFVTGLVDDRRNLRPGVKLLLQIIAALPLVLAGVRIKFFIPGDFLGALLTIGWIVLLANAFNFIDNMNGLSAGVALFAALNFYLISRGGNEYFMMAIFALFIGSLAGFLPHNFPRARLFMGDSGSMFIGYMLAALSTLVTYYRAGVPTQLPVVAPLIVLGVPIFDTVSVLLIRWRRGLPLMKGDQNHFSHRLAALGFTRVQTVLIIYLITFTVGLTAVNLRWLDWAGAALALLQAVLFFVVIFLLEHAGREKKT